MRIKVLRKKQSWLHNFLRRTYQISIDDFQIRLNLFQDKLSKFKELDVNPIHEEAIKQYFKLPHIKEEMELKETKILRDVLINIKDNGSK